MDEDNTKKVILTIRLSKELYRKLVTKCYLDKTSVSEFLRGVIRDKIK